MSKHDNGNKGELIFRLSARDFLKQRVHEMLKPEAFFGAQIDQEDFQIYGTLSNGIFVPYWKNDESFEEFTEKVVGLNVNPGLEIGDAADNIFRQSNIPLFTEDQTILDHMVELFTSDEIDLLRAHALAVQDEFITDLTAGMSRVGWIDADKRTNIVSPLDLLHERADIQIADFYSEIHDVGDTVFGITQYQTGESVPDIVAYFRQIEAIYSEPFMKKFPRLDRSSWAVVVSGESSPRHRTVPIFTLDFDHIDLAVTDIETNKTLTRSLLGKQDLVRYWIGNTIVDIQRERMRNLQHIFEMVSYRKECDLEGREWKRKDVFRKDDGIDDKIQI